MLNRVHRVYNVLLHQSINGRSSGSRFPRFPSEGRSLSQVRRNYTYAGVSCLLAAGPPYASPLRAVVVDVRHRRQTVFQHSPANIRTHTNTRLDDWIGNRWFFIYMLALAFSVLLEARQRESRERYTILKIY